MDTLQGLTIGFGVSFSPFNLLFCLSGVAIGTFVGVLPGMGPIGAMALLLPATFAYGPTSALIMLTGIYYGAMYGGAVTGILVNVPGDAAAVVTTIDGHQMAKKGRAGAALAVAAVASFSAGTMGIICLTLFAPLLVKASLKFGAPEYFAISSSGLILLSRLGRSSPAKSFLMISFGVLLGTIGMDPLAGVPRFTFGYLHLSMGISFVPVAMGLYGVAEVLMIVERSTGIPKAIKFKFRELFPSIREWKKAFPAIFRGGTFGFLVGLVPGPAAIIATFASYAVEKRISKQPEDFGKGAIEGVAAPEASNNAATSGAMVPLLALGIPFSPATAILLGALVIHGVQPGPLLMSRNPEIFWGVVVSMYLGNCMLLVLNLPLVGMWASVLRIPQNILIGLVLVLCFAGAYSVNNSLFDIYILIVMGVLGYILKKLKFDMAPLLLGLVLGPMIEKYLQQSLFMCDGSVWALISRPLSGTLFSISLGVILLPQLFRLIRKKVRSEAN